mmetsp:Transcript_108554/g.280673  ORF Transcript_108554/g.280673 Transcript_108554/m.280673 type:complete len:253 (-) Transcript_108554:330-1088(-)
MSSTEEPEPPWKTKDTGLSLSQPSCSLMYFCVLCKITGLSSTLPGAYTPCTFPKAAATVKLPLGTEDNALYTSQTSSGCVYNRLESTSVLSTPSSSPPVMPSSISKSKFTFAMRSRYFLQMAMFSSSGSSDKSSMCDENKGSPFFSKYSSFAFSRPSNQGSQDFWQWSVWRITGTPYNSATARTWSAPATLPAMQAASSTLSAAFPAMNWPPPREKVTMIGPPAFFAASMHALIELVPTMFTPGMANSFSLA